MIRIVPMEQRHTEQVAELEKLCFTDPWSLRSITSELDNPLSLWLVAEWDETVVGYVGSQSVMGEADMMNLAVHSDYRRRGIAHSLVSHLVEALRKEKVYCLTLEVRDSNEAARNLYTALGFAQIGRRKNYYFDPKEDALILRKEWEV